MTKWSLTSWVTNGRRRVYGVKSNEKERKNHSPWNNNLYVLKQLFTASKLRLPFEMLFQGSKGVTQTLIYTVLFGSVIYSIAEGREFTKILAYILLAALFTAVLTRKYDSTMDEIIANEKKYNRKNTALTLFMDFMNDKVIYIGILLYVSYLIVVKKKLLIGDYLIIQNAVVSMTWRISAFINSGLDLQQSGKFAGLLREFMETKPLTYAKSKGETPDPEMDSIEFKNVSFSYDGTNKVLKNINVSIKRGSRILIVGKNGAGKSTFVKLMMNLYQPTAGEILYNGKNIQKYDLSQYRHMYSTVFQDFCLYALTVGQNVAMDNYSEDRIPYIESALTEADLMKKIHMLDEGILSNVTKEMDDNGFVPSGGEAQKMAISRAIYQAGRVIVLDEPSSALDPLSEAKINELMLNASGGPIYTKVLLKGLEKYLYDKAARVDMECYDNTEYYNEFIWATNNSGEMVTGACNSIGAFLGYILHISGVISMVVIIDPSLSFLTFVSVAVNIVVTSYLEKRKMEYRKEIVAVG